MTSQDEGCIFGRRKFKKLSCQSFIQEKKSNNFLSLRFSKLDLTRVCFDDSFYSEDALHRQAWADSA
jgi:hypothetical protein